MAGMRGTHAIGNSDLPGSFPELCWPSVDGSHREAETVTNCRLGWWSPNAPRLRDTLRLPESTSMWLLDHPKGTMLHNSSCGNAEKWLPLPLTGHQRQTQETVLLNLAWGTTPELMGFITGVWVSQGQRHPWKVLWHHGRWLLNARHLNSQPNLQARPSNVFLFPSKRYSLHNPGEGPHE